VKVSIIIRCLNEEKLIEKLFIGIENQNYQNKEVIVVDSGSTDKTLEIASKYDVKVVHIKPEDFSFGFALNKGCEHANGDFLLFASAHVYPTYTTWLAEMIRAFQDERVALVYGRQIGNELSKYSETRLFSKWFPEESNFDQHFPFCNNANCAIRKSLWLGQKFDEKLTGLEDLAWAKEILEKGHRIAYNAKAMIVHVHEETPSRIYNRYRREAIALKKIFPNEKFDLSNFLRLSLVNIISDYYQAIQSAVFFKNILEIPQFRILQFWGTYKGYRQKGGISSSLRNRFYYPNELKKEVNSNTEQDISIEYE